MQKNSSQGNSVPRPPIVVVMGHIDHGKSTLLDYIRKSNVAEGEAGGITQHISAYEVVHKAQDGSDKRITFIDTPGHEAFSSMRVRGAKAADVAILVVSAEDGVKAQTLEALNAIKKSETPFIVAINKIDKPAANVERTKNTLVENEIYIEGYGGDIPCVPVSAKTGEGIPDLLDMILLVADLQGLTGNPHVPAEGFVIESNVDAKKGTSATLIITNGTLEMGMCIAAGGACSPVRAVEDFMGRKITSATFSSPIRITGFDNVPEAGILFQAFDSKKDAEEIAEKYKTTTPRLEIIGDPNAEIILPLIIKADVLGTLDAIEKELEKAVHEKVAIKIIQRGVGDITENDLKIASGAISPLTIGFRVKADSKARSSAEKFGTPIEIFDIIYNITDRVKEEVLRRVPKQEVEEMTGEAKILKCFSVQKDKQVVGGKVITGVLKSGARAKIMRRDNILGEGKILELQQTKSKVGEVAEGFEFGLLFESKVELVEGDRLEAFIVVTK